MKLLEVDKLSKDFGGLRAVSQVSFTVEEGQIVGLIGPNGAGKSTVFNCIAGVYPPSEGEVRFAGQKISGQRPWNLAKKGISRTFQIVKPFSSRSVLYNVMVGSFAVTDSRSTAERKSLEILDFLHLGDKRDIKSGNLTIADRKRLEIARALATEPRLLLLDEVMAGLRPTEVDEVVGIIRSLRDRGITVLIIEHIMRAIMALSDQIIVIHFGSEIARGKPAQVASDANVIKAYLGDDYASA